MKMATIEVPECLVNDLLSIGKELTAQSNQGSSWPIWYVSEIKKFGAQEDRADYTERIDWDAIDIDDLCDRCKDQWENKGEIPDECSACSDDTFWHYNEERQYSSYGSCFFLTRKACQEYIDSNSHHFNDPKPYCDSAFRNDEIQPIIQALIVAAGGEIPSNHYGRLPDQK